MYIVELYGKLDRVHNFEVFNEHDLRSLLLELFEESEEEIDFEVFNNKGQQLSKRSLLRKLGLEFLEDD